MFSLGALHRYFYDRPGYDQMSDASTAPYTADVNNPLCCNANRTGERCWIPSVSQSLQEIGLPFLRGPRQTQWLPGLSLARLCLMHAASSPLTVCADVQRSCPTDEVSQCRLWVQRQPAGCHLCQRRPSAKDQDSPGRAAALAHCERSLEGERAGGDGWQRILISAMASGIKLS